MALREVEQRWLAGAEGPAMQLAMQMMVTAADVSGAREFVEIEFAHIGSSFYAGRVSVDFAEYILENGGSFAVPTYTNASLIDCATPSLRSSTVYPEEVAGAQRLMEIYTQLGCAPMWSCAPYAEPAGRPGLGAHIAGSESNAVSFFNSVLGARTNKYGDFIDCCAAMTGRVPMSGLHTDMGRVGSHVFDVGSLPSSVVDDRSFPHVLGIILGQDMGSGVPVVDGLESASEDDLKAIAAAAATSGAVEMFHVVGITPEAATLERALGGRADVGRTVITPERIRGTQSALSSKASGSVDAVCLGTPHFTVSEFAELRGLLSGRRVADDVRVLVTTSRAVLAELELRGWADEFRALGVELLLDTCTYYTPRAGGVDGLVATNSAKWAYYAPGILGVDVYFGSLEECVEGAVSGKVGP